MATFKRGRKNKFTVVDNEILKDDRLSWKAKGIIVYIMSLPDDWEIHTKELVKHATDGRDSLMSGIQELKKYGYMIYKKYQDEETGTFIHEYDVYDKPQQDYPEVENPAMDNPALENPSLLQSTNELSTNQQNTKKNSSSSKDIVEKENLDDIPYEEIVDYLNKKIGTHYRHTTKKTRRLIRARWNEGFKLVDFKTVIEKKVMEWLGDKEMEKYLRPVTLFGTKFEGYLNQLSVNNQSDNSGIKQLKKLWAEAEMEEGEESDYVL